MHLTGTRRPILPSPWVQHLTTDNTRWKVEYKFPIGLEVENVVDAYPSLGLAIEYLGNKIVGFSHELEAEDRLDAGKVMALSASRLAFFLQVLQYRYGPPLPQYSQSVVRISPDPGTDTVGTGFRFAASRASICLRIRMPNPARFAGHDARLLKLLRLAADAVAAKNPAEAVRNYYMILEDLYAERGKGSQPREAIELKYIRDFVSHAKIRSKDILEFLNKELGRSTDRFDPSNAQHEDLVNRYRQLGYRLVEDEIDRLLQ